MNDLLKMYKKNDASFTYEVVKSKGIFLSKKEELAFLKLHKEFLDFVCINDDTYFDLVKSNLDYSSLINNLHPTKEGRTIILLDRTIKKYSANFIVINKPFKEADLLDTDCNILTKGYDSNGVKISYAEDWDYLESFRMFIESLGYKKVFVSELMEILSKVKFTIMVM